MAGNIKIGGAFPGGSSGGGGSGTVTKVTTQGGPFLAAGAFTTAGTISNSATTLTSNAILLGAGTAAPAPLGSLGTTTTLLHGNAAGAPTFGAVSLSADVTGLLPFANLATLAATSLFGNGAITGATGGNIAIGTGLTLSTSGTLSAGSSGGTVTQVVAAAGPFLANTTITASGTITGSAATLTNHGVLIGQAAAAPVATAVMTDGQLLIGTTAADPAPQTMSGDATITKAGVFSLGSVVAGGTVGSAALIPVITFDTKGRITATSTAAVPVTAADHGLVINSGTVQINNVVTLTGTAAGTLSVNPGSGTTEVVINLAASGGTQTLSYSGAFAYQPFTMHLKQGATASVVVLNSGTVAGFVFGATQGPTSFTATPSANVTDSLFCKGITTGYARVYALDQGFVN